MGATLLITGGAGLIGSHLAHHWQASGGRVRVLDDFSTGYRDNLAGLDPGRLEVLEGSVLDPAAVLAALEGAGAVAHLASVVGVERVLADPLRTWTVGVEGSRRVLEAAAERRLPVLLASSSEVYGCSSKLPFREDGSLALGPPERPRWVYAAAKAAAESLALALARRARQRLVVARLFNTSGPRQRPESGMVLPVFARAALAGEPLVVHGDGRQSRCFCHAEDSAEALARLLEVAPVGGTVVNVGTDREITVGDLATLVVERAGSRSPIRRIPSEQARGGEEQDAPRRVPHLGRLEAATGWAPRHDLTALVDAVLGALRGTSSPS
jgi:UDP-glucose 4-epimerase